MPKNRIKIDVDDRDGNKFTITLEGHLTRNKVLQVLDFVDLLGGSSVTGENAEDVGQERSDFSKFEKVQNVVLRKFPIGWFTSQEVMVIYEDTLDEPIGLSTVSTYLTRLSEKGILIKAGPVTRRRFKVANFIKNNGSRYNVPP